ncbi:MAG TPA: lipopolysaccharide biosynthesis protein RfbH, partial [Thermoanaerobaculia bacterium]|nr:lipopolysaccharide biosynthesis protein RfbH [Thermoanaerobaculia bacterium]
MTTEELRKRILDLVGDFAAEEWLERPFVPGETPVPVSGRVFDGDDVTTLVDASLDFWLTAGRFASEFERALAKLLSLRACLLCNSGSSANLLALSSLTASELSDRRLRPGDEVITAAAGFPTTVNPIHQNGLVPVFVDIDLPTYDAPAARVAEAVGARTKAIFLAHTLGNPYDLDGVTAIAREKGLWLIEDNCDALGSLYRGRLTGTFGDFSTFSFYPAHHITMGEGGAVATDQPLLKKIAASFRDWGRDCWCDPGKADTCGKRFDWQLGELPAGYDHKYIYSHVGYNLKATDLQAAVGVAQLKKLPRFIAARRRNWTRLAEGLAPLSEHLILPAATPGSEPAWFGFPLTLQPQAPFSRREVVRHLESRRVATRQIFAGNILRQPAYQGLPHRVAGSLHNTDIVMERSFWIGVCPGITDRMIDYV